MTGWLGGGVKAPEKKQVVYESIQVQADQAEAI